MAVEQNKDLASVDAGGLTLGHLFAAVYHGWRIVVACLVVALLLGVVYLSFLAQPLYTAAAIIGPNQQRSDSSPSGASRLLAAATNMNLGQQGGDFQTVLQMMYSARLASSLQKDPGIVQEIFPGWNAAEQRWVEPGGLASTVKGWVRSLLGMPQWQAPTPTRIANYIADNVAYEPLAGGGPLRGSSLVRVSYKFRDREFAMRLLNLLLRRSDDLIRDDRLSDTNNRIAYLENLVRETQQVELRDSFRSLLADQQRNQMMLRADRYYALEMIDPPDSDLSPTDPRASMVLLQMFSVGAITSLAILFAILWSRMRETARTGRDCFSRPYPNPFGIFRGLIPGFRR
jgi:hypothetical protein